MKQNIVLIGPAHPFRGGMSTFNEALAKQFIAEGHHVEIYTFTLQYPSFLFPGTTQFRDEAAPEGIQISRKINSINPFNWINIGLELRKKKPSLVLVRYWLPFMGPCFGSILRIVKANNFSKIICIADNIIPHEKRIGDKQFTNYFIKSIDAFITMSATVLHDLNRLTSKPAIQVAHPLYTNFGEKIDANRAKQYLGIDSNLKIVLFFGFIRKYKGLDLLIEAIHILKEKKFIESNQIKFLIAGEFYENPQSYLELIKKYQLEDCIILKNEFIADSEVKYYVSSANCVIQPYKNATQSGVTPLAYHFEKPMIVTNVGGLPDMVPDTIGLVSEPNAQAIAQKIETFFSLDESILVQNIKEEKKKYTWDKITSAILSLAKKVT